MVTSGGASPNCDVLSLGTRLCHNSKHIASRSAWSCFTSVANSPLVHRVRVCRGGRSCRLLRLQPHQTCTALLKKYCLRIQLRLQLGDSLGGPVDELAALLHQLWDWAFPRSLLCLLQGFLDGIDGPPRVPTATRAFCRLRLCFGLPGVGIDTSVAPTSTLAICCGPLVLGSG